VVVTTPGGALVSAVRLTVPLPPALLSTAVAAIGLAAVTRAANAEDDAAAFGTTANGQEEDVGHAPSSSSPESPPAFSPRAGKRTPSLGLKRACVGTTTGPRLDARLPCRRAFGADDDDALSPDTTPARRLGPVVATDVRWAFGRRP